MMPINSTVQQGSSSGATIGCLMPLICRGSALIFLEKIHSDFAREKKKQANGKGQKDEPDSCPVLLLGKLRIQPVNCQRPDQYPDCPGGITCRQSDDCQEQIENYDEPQVALDILWKSYPQSQRNAVSGLINRQRGHFIGSTFLPGPKDPTSATAATRRVNWNSSALPSFAAAHGSA